MNNSCGLEPQFRANCRLPENDLTLIVLLILLITFVIFCNLYFFMRLRYFIKTNKFTLLTFILSFQENFLN